MADKKISALTGATTPLAGTEVLPIVQSNATVKVAVSDLTAGRAISATQMTLTTGNLIVANGQGIDFSATPGTGTSELLNDYEEGTWTPAVLATTSGSITLNATDSKCSYTKVGRIVTLTGYIRVASVSLPVGSIRVIDVPFTPAGSGTDYQFRSAGSIYPANLVSTPTNPIVPIIFPADTSFYVFGIPAADVQSNSDFTFSVTYTAA
jgi:hypothetical protein